MVTCLPSAFLPGSAGSGEVLLILVVMLLLFGSKNLPRIARTLGKTLEEFRKASRDVTREIMGLAEEDQPTRKKEPVVPPDKPTAETTPPPTPHRPEDPRSE